jgi:hypothetical protein
MEKLMLEMPSPNVTKMIPLDLGSKLDKLVSPSDFVVTPHGKGIFEFTYHSKVANLDGYIKTCVEDAFLAYKTNIYDVGVNGLKDDPLSHKVGSTRFCAMDYDFAEFLTKIVKYRSAVDVIQDENGNWMEMLNVSQYFRFMRYKTGGEHFPHYDSDYTYEYNGAVTKYSLVAYFTRCQTGQFAFVDDQNTEFEGKIQDWSRQAKDEEIYLKVTPTPLKILVFPHTLCHTVLPFTDKNTDRIICRGDLLFKKAQ